MPLLIWLLAFVITGGAAAVQGVAGVGFAMIAVPVLALLDPRLAPVPQLLVVIPLTLYMAWQERHAVDMSGIGWIIVGRFPGLFVGLALLAVATQQVLDAFIGTVVVVAVVVIATGFKVHRTRTTKFAAGVAAGTTGVVASIGGPPVALLYNDDEAATIRSTLAAVFTIGLTLSLLGRAATGAITAMDVRISLVLFPAVVIGYVVARRIRGRVPATAIRTIILVVSATAGVGLLVRALVG